MGVLAQAKLPYSEETREYIADIDVDADIELLREQGIELQPSSERVLRVCTTLLQRAAAIGCCPADIAGMMSADAQPHVRPREARVRSLRRRSAPASWCTGPREPDDDLEQDDRVEARFMVEYMKLLDSYLEGFEPQVEL